MQVSDAIVDLIVERPHNFKLGERSFSIKPLTLGKMLILSKYNTMLLSSLRGRQRKQPQEVLLDLCKTQPKIVSHIIAIYITADGERLLDDDYVAELDAFICKEMDDVQKATFLQLYYEEKTAAYFMGELRITEEKEKQRLAMRAKDKSSSLSVGGVSIFGNLIDFACEKFGWTYQYVLWGVSYNVLQLMIADMPQSIYLTEKERARAHINDDGRILRGESQADVDYFKSLCDG